MANLENEIEYLLKNEVIKENGKLILLEEDCFNQEAVQIIKTYLKKYNKKQFQT